MNKKSIALWNIAIIISLVITLMLIYNNYQSYQMTIKLWEDFENQEIGADKILQDKGIHIWDGNTSREFLDKRGLTEYPEGDMGETYGFNFRHFGGKYKDCHTDYNNMGVDQVKEVLKGIKENPNSRRLLINLWNPSDLKEVVLPPCHVLYQFRVYGNKLSCSMYQRSGDMGLGVPFNIASAALMTYIFAF